MKTQAPALPNDDAFFNRFFAEIGGYRDTAGRPLHEVDFRAEEQPEAFKTCPFHDSRKGTLINNTALRQIMQDWRGIEDGVSFFAGLSPLDSQQAPDLARAWRISLSTMFAPLYLMHRREAPVANGKIPTVVSGLFKIMLDVPTTLDLMFFDDPPGITIRTGADAARYIYDFANDTTILVNGEYACAGSPKLIGSIAARLTDVPGAGTPLWQALFPDPVHFKRFSALMTVQYTASLLYQAALAVSMEAVCPHAVVEISPDAAPLAAYERRRRFVLKAWATPSRRAPALHSIANAATQNAPDVAAGLRMIVRATTDYLDACSAQDLHTVMAAHDIYRSTVLEYITELQKRIHGHLGTSTLFTTGARFTRNTEAHPAEILRQHCPVHLPTTRKTCA